MEDQNSNKNFLKNAPPKVSFFLGLFAGIAVLSCIALVVILTVVIKNKASNTNNNANVAVNQNVNADTNTNTNQPAPTGPATAPVTAAGITTFSMKQDAQICEEKGKPVVYLFSTTWCPHCVWVKDTFDKVAKEYVAAGKIVAYHWEIDTNDDTLTSAVETSFPAAAQAIYQEFEPAGHIPAFVIGCKYFRVGNGYEKPQNDLVAEEKELRAAIDAVVANK